MYEMFTGRPPYTGDNPTTILYQHLEGKAPPPRELNSHLVPELQAIIQKAMAVDPAQRFQSMEALGKNQVFARWLQKNVVITDYSSVQYLAQGGYGPDRQ